MDDMQLNEVSNAFIKRIHDEGDVVQKVELPAFANQRIAKKVPKRNGIAVYYFWEISNSSELPWRLLYIH